MTDKELIEMLKPLEPVMLQYAKNKTGRLTADDNQIIKEVYPTLQAMALGTLPKQYKSNCSTCVKNVFDVVVSVYFRLKEEN